MNRSFHTEMKKVIFGAVLTLVLTAVMLPLSAVKVYAASAAMYFMCLPHPSDPTTTVGESSEKYKLYVCDAGYDSVSDVLEVICNEGLDDFIYVGEASYYYDNGRYIYAVEAVEFDPVTNPYAVAVYENAEGTSVYVYSASSSSDTLVTFYDVDGIEIERTEWVLLQSPEEELPEIETTTEHTGNADLDLEKDTDEVALPESTTINQYYDVTTENQFKDVTKVKIDWKTTSIKVSSRKNRKWDPDKLMWVETADSAESLVVSHGDKNGKDAVFTLTNLSSVKVNARVSFAVENSLAATFRDASFYHGLQELDATGIQIDTIVSSDADRSVADELPPSEIIDVVLKLNEEAFAGLNSVSHAKYGTYTITLGE